MRLVWAVAWAVLLLGMLYLAALAITTDPVSYARAGVQ